MRRTRAESAPTPAAGEGPRRRRWAQGPVRVLVALLAAASLAILLAACGDEDTVGDALERGDVVVYAGRKESLIAPMLRAFQDRTGIRVVVKSGTNGALAQEIIAERGNPQASIFISQDAPTCEVLRGEGVLAPNDSPALREIPERFRAEDGSWVGISGRARVLIHNTDLVQEADLPQSVLELTEPQWRGRVAMASGREASVASWAGALIEQLGRAEALAFLKALKANGTAVLENHTAVREAVGKGEFAIGIVNHYYFYLEKAEGSPVGITYPDQEPVAGAREPLGDLVNAASVCLVKDAPQADKARELMDFMTSAEAQSLFAQQNFEYPTRPGTPPPEGVEPLDGFRQADVDLHEIDPVAGLELLEEAGIQ